MNQLPASKSSELLQRLSALAQRGGGVDDFALKGIEREAVNLLQTDAAGGYMALGVLSSIRGDAVATRDYHEKSLRLLDDWVGRENYGNSLGHLRLWPEAMAQFVLAEKLGAYPELLRKIIRFGVQSGHPVQAIEAHAKLVKMAPELIHNQELINIMNTATVLRSSGLTDHEMASINALADQVIKKHGATVTHSNVWLDIWSDHTPSVVCYMHVTGADVSAMSDDLIDLKVEADTPALRSGQYYVGFMEAPHDDHA